MIGKSCSKLHKYLFNEFLEASVVVRGERVSVYLFMHLVHAFVLKYERERESSWIAEESMGSDSDAVGRAVASYNRDLRFESSHRQNRDGTE